MKKPLAAQPHRALASARAAESTQRLAIADAAAAISSIDGRPSIADTASVTGALHDAKVLRELSDATLQSADDLAAVRNSPYPPELLKEFMGGAGLFAGDGKKTKAGLCQNWSEARRSKPADSTPFPARVVYGKTCGPGGCEATRHPSHLNFEI